MDLNSQNLRGSKNLLAFSYGRDSTALFYALVEQNVSFDIAMVNYNVRPDSKIELQAAKELAMKYNKKLFFLEPFLDLSSGNFEARAREVRYEFFEKIMHLKGYDNLLTAQHLNDRMEWFLMQLLRGGSLSSMLGFMEVTSRNGYLIIRPLYNASRDEILDYLHSRDIFYFYDSSNDDLSFRRNYIRARWGDDLLKEGASGIKRTFEILNHEARELYGELEIFTHKEQGGDFLEELTSRLDALEEGILHIKGGELSIYAFLSHGQLRDLYKLEKLSKMLGYVISRLQREEILKSRFNLLLGDRISIAKGGERIFISSHMPKVAIPKALRGLLAKHSIPARLRPQIFQILKHKNLVNENFCHKI